MSRTGLMERKAYEFALAIVMVAKRLQIEQREYVLSKQLLRSGTSIGANIQEANAAQSRKDFASKMAVASKEARESYYWLRLLRDSGYIEADHAGQLLYRCDELVKILTASVKTAQHTSTTPVKS